MTGSTSRIARVLHPEDRRYWARPIGDFRLVVNKRKPTDLISFCGSGIRKFAPTLFEMRQRNFTPEADLDILIMSRAGE